MQEPIRVTRSFLPPLEEYQNRVADIWERGHLTNHGPNILELEANLRSLLKQQNLWSVTNGTIALQVAFKALELTGEVITTPFSYVATVSSLVWEGLTPVFVDINEKDFCIDPQKIEGAITERTSAILATHVYGYPCDVQAIEQIAKKHGLKVIYDAAHAFGVEINGRSILDFGDISTLSFHATKVFHSGEGGAVVAKDQAVAHKVSYLRNFGHNGEEEFWGIGVNAKVSELHAAMGNCVLPHFQWIVEQRKRVCNRYDGHFRDVRAIYRFELPSNVTHNYSYYPIIFNSEIELLKVREALHNQNIFPRRYFYPSLNRLPYLPQVAMPVADSISTRVLSLPLFTDLANEDVDRIASIILKTLS
jgi:dTDP-4-amino-4,6-dideoxygalactose transaminase